MISIYFVVLMLMNAAVANIVPLAEKKIETKELKIKINLAAFYTNSRVYRGALIWNAPLIAAGPSVIINDKYGLGKGGISYIKSLGQRHQLTLGLTAFDDNEPQFPFYQMEKTTTDYKNERKPTNETYVKYDYTYGHSFKLESSLHKDFTRYNGLYLSTEAMVSFIPLVAFGIEMGIGEKSSNEYVYGKGSSAGLAHSQYFTSVLFPFMPLGGIMILRYGVHEIHGADKYNAQYIRGNNIHSNFSVVSVWKLD